MLEMAYTYYGKPKLIQEQSLLIGIVEQLDRVTKFRTSFVYYG